MKPGDLVEVIFRRRRATGPNPIGVLLEIRREEYPLQGERELVYVVLVGETKRHLQRRWLRLVDESG